MSREQRAQAFLDQIDDATARLLSQQLKLTKLASNKGKSLGIIAVETAEIEASSGNMLRAVEDLLGVCRSVKEAWILGQIRSPSIAPNEEEVLRRREALRKLVETLGNF